MFSFHSWEMYMTRHFISAVQLLTPTSLAALSPSTLPDMFSLTKCFMTLVLVSTSALSLTINAPSSPQSGSTTTITFTSTPTDPTFSIELFHPSFNEAIAIANNVDPSTGQITVALPIVPAGDQYTLEAVNITNINQVFATSADFNIAAAPSPSMTLSSASATAPASIPVGGSSASASGIPSGVIPSGVSGANTGSASIPSATLPSLSSVPNSGSQSAAISGASSAASGSPSTGAGSTVVPFQDAAGDLILAALTALFAGAWVL